MANTYTQIHVQVVFAVKFRNAAIRTAWKAELYKYITGIVQNYGHKLIIINGMPDHVHILIGLRPTQSLSDLIKEVKMSSSRWINQQNLIPEKFAWQEGFGAFSYSKDQVKDVIRYIEKQEEHHRNTTFQEEYLRFLREFGIKYDEKYLFKQLS